MFVQWSEVHDIPRNPNTKLAQLKLLPGRFMIEGPDELIIQTETILTVMQGQDDEAIKLEVQKLWANWHVICSVSGEKVLVCDLRYWLNGAIYASPYLIPNPYK
jgi:hypothetical protein